MKTTDHWQGLLEFCKYEMLTGGPDPHMKAVLKMSEGLPVQEQLWRAALYVGVYNVPSAEAIWREWPAGRHHPENQGVKLYDWLEEHWRPGGIKTRKECRSRNTPTKLIEYLEGYRQTVDRLPWTRTETDFEKLWKFAIGLPRVGRYAATKLVELWWQLGLTGLPHGDIRAKGGWSPRSTLHYLYPEKGLRDEYDNSEFAVLESEKAARDVKHWLRDMRVHISDFELEVMLCEYKASYSSRRQYPGRSLDSELGYELAIRPYWKIENTEHMHVRGLLSPEWTLGEFQGWTGPREPLGDVWADYGYTWTDSLYSYTQTTDFRNPVRKAPHAA